MCLIVHKPAGVPVPEDLIAAAAAHNPDGWGLMGFCAAGRLILQRSPTVNVREVVDTVRALPDAEFALHLRRQIRGGSGLDNVHPFKIVDGVHLMHNGTLPIGIRVPGRSDTWHLITDLLRPLAQRHTGLFSDHAFLRVLELGLRPENKVVLLDQRRKRIEILNREHGAECEGLWLSSTRWIDRTRFPLARPPQPQERQFVAAGLGFL